MQTISSTEAVRRFGDLLACLKHTGESFVVTKNDKPVARLVPVGRPVGATGAEILRNLDGLPVAFGFADDLERINQADVPPENPWD